MPAPTPEPSAEPVVPELEPTPEADSQSGGGEAASEPEPAPAPEPKQDSAYYPNCKAARAAGAAPMYKGEPGYRSELDRDGDGIACDKTR